MSKVIKKPQILQVVIKTPGNGRSSYQQVRFEANGQMYQMDIHRCDIRDFIEENIRNYDGWFAANFCSWEQESETELAMEMAATVWKEEWILLDYLGSFSADELSDYQVTTEVSHAA